DAIRGDFHGFNDAQVAARRGHMVDAIRREYDEANGRVMALAGALGAERLREAGTIPWYGPQYSLDDFIVYANYAHTREHCPHLRAFKLRRAEAATPRGD